MKPRVIVRCDGGTDIGMGHVVRCLALAHMLHDYFDISFVLQETDNTIYKWIEDNGFSFKTIIRSNDEETAVANLLEVLAPSTNRESIVVLDGYHIQTLHQERLKKEGYRVVAIDDLHSWPHVADAILNHAPGIASAAYQAAHSTRLLLGADYALLRPSLLEASKRERKIQSPKHFLISMGAADEYNYTLFFARLVRKQFPSAKLNLLTSTLNPHLEELYTLTTAFPDRVSLQINLSTEQLTELLIQTDVVICPASTISLEACAAGCTLITGYTAPNQRGILAGLQKSGAGFSLDSFEKLEAEQVTLQLEEWLLDENLRISQLHNQRALIDGKSGFRLALAFLEIEKNASLRSATKEDAELYFQWANDPDVRANSYQTADIDWNDHVKWFEDTLASSENALYLYSISEKPAGQIRLRMTEKKAVISYSVAHDFRGKGLGKWMLTHISLLMRVAHPQVRQLEGWVKKTNVASLKAFQSGGYQVAEESSDSILFRLELHS